MSILSNKINGSVTLHFTANTGNVVVVGNSTVSNLAIANIQVQGLANGEENVVSADISSVIWGGASNSSAVGYVSILRGTTPVMTLTNSGIFNLGKEGCSLSTLNTSNLQVNFTGPEGFVIIKLKKNLQHPINIAGSTNQQV